MLNFKNPVFFTSLFALLILTGCEQKNVYNPPPAPKVTVSKPLVMDAENYMEFTGTTEVHKRVEIRARVKGFLDSVHFKEGDFVEKGQQLFNIDPRTFQAQVDQAKAAIQFAEVELDKAEETLKRNVELRKKKAVTELEYIRSKASRDKASAEVIGAKAVLTEAKLNLAYTDIKSPITGKIGKYEVNVGNLVGDGQSTLLTTVVSFSPIFAYFNVSEQQLLNFSKQSREKNGPQKNKSISEKDKILLSLALSNETDFPHKGYIDYTDYELDATSGTFLVRAIFPNENQEIIPGLFIRLRMKDKQFKNAVMVNENAFSADMIGRYLYIVNDEKRVEKKYIKKDSLGSLINGFRVIKDGISADDLVIVNGIQRARDGIKVNAHEEKVIPPKSFTSSNPQQKKQPAKVSKKEKPTKAPKKPAQKTKKAAVKKDPPKTKKK